MEAESFHITNQHVDSAPVEVPTPSRSGVSRAAGPYRSPKVRPRPTPSDRRRLADTTLLKLNALAQVRLGLQQRAPANLRRHVQRAVVRFVALVIADLAAFGLMRELIRGVRDAAWLGGWLSDKVQAALPYGYMNGWQFASALFMGLLILGNYAPGDRRRDPWRLFLACALATALPLWTMLWARGFEVVLLQYSLTVVLVWAGVVAERLAVDGIIAKVRDPERDAVDTLFVGPARACNEAAASPAFAGGTEYRPIGFVDLASPAGSGALGEIRDLPILLAASGAEVVVICGFFTTDQFRDVVDAALTSGCQVLSVPRVLEVAGVHPVTVWRHGQALVELTTPSLKGQQLLVKRVVDVVGAALSLVIAAPLMIAIGAAIKLDSPGPVLFSQDRVGFGGRRFRMLKFRTMRRDAEAQKQAVAHLNHTGDSRLFKIPNDPRVTRMGGWLRRWSIDELPQLWNVLMGDMSLIGPRPFFEADLVSYADHHFRRLGAKPGITGLWQVKGRSSVTDFEEVVRLDREYIERWSLWLDLAILVGTLPAVLKGRGAY